MLEQLIQLTASEEYLEDGGMKIKEVLMRPWQKEEIKITLEIFIDDWKSDKPRTQTWEIIGEKIMHGTPRGLHGGMPPGTQIKVLNDHPILWNYTASTYFSVMGRCANIGELMGELFITHQQLCGGWVDFQDLYSSLPETLQTQRENQLEIPNQLSASCFGLLQKHRISVTINEVAEGEKDLSVLLFSRVATWPDELNFSQPYIVARSFRENRIEG